MLKKLGLKQINADYSIFVTSLAINGPIVSTFNDNVKVIEVKKSNHIKRVKRKFADTFEMVDMRPISFYLSLKIERDCQKKTLKLSQPAYIDKILLKYHLDLTKPYNTPINKAILLPN